MIRFVAESKVNNGSRGGDAQHFRTLAETTDKVLTRGMVSIGRNKSIDFAARPISCSTISIF